VIVLCLLLFVMGNLLWRPVFVIVHIFPAANADNCQVIFAARQGKSIITSPEMISHNVFIAKVRA
jgi:hypothetical protein